MFLYDALKYSMFSGFFVSYCYLQSWCLPVYLVLMLFVTSGSILNTQCLLPPSL